MNIQKMAEELVKANEQAEAALKEIRVYADADRTGVEACLRRYIAAKLLLSEDEISDNIIQMVRINVAKASNMTVEELKEMDRPGACGSAPAVLSKRVLMYIALQKALEITLPPEKLPGIVTVQELADLILSLLRK